MRLNGTEFYYVSNVFGDIIYLLNSDGDIVVEYRYDAWGNVTYQTDTSGVSLATKNPYLYRGYRFDSETNLYYLNSRYYNPETGRFINADELLGSVGDILGHNMYAYTQNNPVMRVDPNGDSFLLICMIVLATSALTLSLVGMSSPESHPEENFSSNWGASPNPTGFGGEAMGYGYGFGIAIPGQTEDLGGNTYETQTTFGNVSVIGLSLTQSSDGSNTMTGAISIFYLSYDLNDWQNIDSWGAGISLGYSFGSYTGSSHGSFDIDYLQLIRDAFSGQGGEKND